MGEEYGETSPFLYFVSHSDRRLAQAVREGRQADYAALLGGVPIPDPLEESVFLSSKLDLTLRLNGRHRLLLDFYRALIRLRRGTRALRAASRKGLKVKTFAGSLVLFVSREREDERLTSLFNFELRPVTLTLGKRRETLLKILDSSAAVWGGPGGTAPERIEAGAEAVSLSLPPLSLAVYGGKHEEKEAAR